MRILVALLAAVAVFLIIRGVALANRPRVRRRAPRQSPARIPFDVRLRQAGVPVTATQYRVGVVVAMAGTFAIAYAMTGTVPISLVPTVAVGFAPRIYYRKRRATNLADRIAAWPTAIDDITTSLTVDSTLHRALTQLAVDGPSPLRATFATYRRNTAVLSLPAALEQARSDLADPVSDQVLEALIAAHDHGTRVAFDVLRSVGEQIREDIETRERIITDQSEIRSQAVVAVILPFGVLGFLISANDQFKAFYSTGVGWFVIALGALMALGGWKLIGALAEIPDEPRVLARKDRP